MRDWASVAARGQLLLSGSVAHASLETAVNSKDVLLFSPADGALGERADAGELEVGEGLPDVALRDAELDPALLEALGEGLQLPGEHIVTASAR